MTDDTERLDGIEEPITRQQQMADSLGVDTNAMRIDLAHDDALWLVGLARASHDDVDGRILRLADQYKARAEAAERERDDARAALDRVNDLADKWAGYGDPVSVGAADQLRAAIEGRS